MNFFLWRQKNSNHTQCAVRWETDQLLSIPSRTGHSYELDLWAEEFGFISG